MYKIIAYAPKKTINLALTTSELRLQDNVQTDKLLNGAIISIIPVEGDIEYRKDYRDRSGDLVTGDWVKFVDTIPFMAVDNNGYDYLRVSATTGRADIVVWL